MSNSKVQCKNNYKDIQTQEIITKCINNKHIKTEVCALFLNQEVKLKYHDEETNLPIKGKHYTYIEIQKVSVEHCTANNLSTYRVNCRVLPYIQAEAIYSVSTFCVPDRR